MGPLGEARRAVGQFVNTRRHGPGTAPRHAWAHPEMLSNADSPAGSLTTLGPSGGQRARSEQLPSKTTRTGQSQDALLARWDQRLPGQKAR